MVDKKDDLDVLGAIRPAHDEVSSFRRSNRAEAPKQSNFNGILVFVILVLSILMGVGGYTLFEVQEKLDQSNELLAKGRDSVLELEKRLAATGTDVSKTLQIMRGQMDLNILEIDKLWSVSHRQNRPNIKKNQAAIEKVRADLNAGISSLKKIFQSVSSSFSVLSSDMTEVQQSLIIDSDEMKTQASLVRAQVQDQAVIVEGNKRVINSLSKQMKDVQESIGVIDKYRAQLNQKLLSLEQLIQDQFPSRTTSP
ncbi:MAG: hypothetical protein VB957_19665 [Pseudomonadales bacterium]